MPLLVPRLPPQVSNACTFSGGVGGCAGLERAQGWSGEWSRRCGGDGGGDGDGCESTPMRLRTWSGAASHVAASPSAPSLLRVLAHSLAHTASSHSPVAIAAALDTWRR